MREVTIIEQFKQIYGMINGLHQSFRLAITGEALRMQAIQKLLISKGLMTDAELQTTLGEVIQEMNSKVEEEQKKATDSLVKPTPEQVAAVTPSTPAPVETPQTNG